MLHLFVLESLHHDIKGVPFLAAQSKSFIPFLSIDSESFCELSPQARVFSTILTAFVGSIVNSVTSDGIVAFMTGWISWLAVLRVLTGALIGLYKAFSSDYARLEQASTS